jgi:hypothetical protein
VLQHSCSADITPAFTRYHQADMWNSFPALSKSRLDSSIASRNHMIGYLDPMQKSKLINESKNHHFVHIHIVCQKYVL